MFGKNKNKTKQTDQSPVSNIPLDESKIHTMKDDLEGGNILEQQSVETKADSSVAETIKASGSQQTNDGKKALQQDSPFMSVEPQTKKEVPIQTAVNTPKQSPSQISRDDLHDQLQKLDTEDLSSLGVKKPPVLDTSKEPQKTPAQRPSLPPQGLPQQMNAQMPKSDQGVNAIDKNISSMPPRQVGKKEIKHSPSIPDKDLGLNSMSDPQGSMKAFLGGNRSNGIHQNGRIVSTNPVEDEPKESVKNVESGGRDLSSVAFYIIVPLIVLGILAAGGYYYWKTRIQEPEPVVIIEPDPIVQPEIVKQEFDTLAPNIFVLRNGDDLVTNLTEIKTEMMNYPTGGMLEFHFANDPEGIDLVPSVELIRKFGLELGEEFESQLGEGVQMFTYNDADGMRIGLVIEMLNRDSAKALLLENEMKLLENSNVLLMGEPTEATDGVFSDSLYRTYEIRYENLNMNESLSMDYSFRRSSLVLGTSKNTIRAILDTLDGEGQ